MSWLYKQACLAIRNLVARNPEYCDVILEAGAESSIRDAQGKMADCDDLAMAALWDLGCAVDLQELWTGTGQGKVQRVNRTTRAHRKCQN